MSDTRYINYDTDAIWAAMTASYIQAGGDLLYPGDEKEMLLRGVQSMLVQSFLVVDNALKMDTLTYAVDEYLDLYGEKRNCYRIEAEAATAEVTIVFSASGIAKTIPAGTQMTADGKRMYKTLSDISQTGTVQTVNVGIEAAEAGEAGNGLTLSATMHFASPNSAVTSITVTQAAAGGRDREDDESYRERIRRYGLINVTTGPAQMYESLAMSVSTAILDAHAINNGAGNVGVYMILETGASANDIISAVTQALSAENKRPLTDTVTVAQATNITYLLNVGYTLSSTASLADLQAAAAEYQQWQDNTIGEAFNPDKLMALLYQAGATRIVWKSGSHFNNGAVQYTTITGSQRCKGTLTWAVNT